MIKQYFKNSTLYKRPSRIIFLIALFVSIIANIFALNKTLITIKGYKKIVPFQGIGYRHKGLNKFIPKDTKYVGYYTGHKIGYGKDSKNFAQAQYMLAPLILDYNNLNHEYIIFSGDERTSLAKIKEIHATPIRRNKFGIILATRKGANDH